MRNKILLLFSLIAFSISVNAAHLEFLGIPINGTINQFQNELFNKGFKISPDNKKVGNGKRLYVGYFANERCNLAIHYNKKTKDVYECRVLLHNSTREEQSQSYTDLKNSLTAKYDSSTIVFKEDVKLQIKDMDETGDKWMVKGEEMETPEGLKWLSPVMYDIPGNITLWKILDNKHTIVINYQDSQNNNKNEDSEMGD